MNKLYFVWTAVYANDNDALIPEVWAQESLMLLENKMVMGNLVYRNFENEIAQFGDTVNTRRPSAFAATRKTDGDAVVAQDAASTNVAVKLNQHWYTSFMLYDGEESKAFKDLREYYLEPAISSIAQAVDQSLAVQAYQFLPYVVGQLGTDPTKLTIIQAREKLTTNKISLDNRNLVVTPNIEGVFLNIADFVNAEKVGDNGTALREGSLGRKFGFNTFMSQNMPSIPTGSTTVGGQIDLIAGYAVGSTVLTVDTFAGAVTTGTWVTIAGDMIPQLVTASVGTPCTQLTISPGLAHAVSNNAVITAYTPGTINHADYAADYGKVITTATFSVAPKTGQMISSVITDPRYGAIGTPTITELWLDRPLDLGIVNGTRVGVGPMGEYSLAFHKNAIALVTRPLAQPKAGTGALSYVANYNGLSVRVTITYSGSLQGHLVTVDILAGIKILDATAGCVLLG